MTSRSQSLINSISEAIVSYLTFESKCGGSEVYCEQMLYAPIQRIATHLNWRVRCEVPVNRTAKSIRGDHRRIDFMFVDEKNEKVAVGLEVKFVKKRSRRTSRSVQVANDIEKLKIFKTEQTRQKKRSVQAYILIIGRASTAPSKSKRSRTASALAHTFTLSQGRNKNLPNLTKEQTEIFYKTSNTHFIASQVRV